MLSTVLLRLSVSLQQRRRHLEDLAAGPTFHEAAEATGVIKCVIRSALRQLVHTLRLVRSLCSTEEAQGAQRDQNDFKQEQVSLPSADGLSCCSSAAMAEAHEAALPFTTSLNWHIASDN